MRRILLMLSMAGCLAAALWGNNLPDFVVSDIIARNDQFVYIKLENRSPYDYELKPELNEKDFLSLFVNDLKRAEYKIKYIDKKLFKRNSIIFFRTNFRVQDRIKIKIKAEINDSRIIPETNFLNNTLEKELTRNE